MAYAYLGRLYGDIGESALSGESTSQAYQLRDRVSDREKFFIAASYDRQVAGNLERRDRPVSCGRKPILATSAPTASCRVAFPLPSADTKGRSKKPRKVLGSIRTFPSGTPILPPPMFSSAAWKRRNTLFSEPLSANWKSLTYWSSDSISPF
jgi:hypothetical protein